MPEPVELQRDDEKRIERLLRTGRYANRAAVVSAGLHLLETERQMTELRDRLSTGYDEAGKGATCDEPGQETIRQVFDQALAKGG